MPKRREALIIRNLSSIDTQAKDYILHDKAIFRRAEIFVITGTPDRDMLLFCYFHKRNR